MELCFYLDFWTEWYDCAFAVVNEYVADGESNKMRLKTLIEIDWHRRFLVQARTN